jgi:hypothetical protein
MPIIREKPDAIYCEDLRVFWESKSCPFLDTSQGAKEPFCTKLTKQLHWDVAGHILKECVDDI